MKTPEKIVSKIINRITAAEEAGWPPVCFGTFYQPERPVTRATNSNSLKQQDEDTVNKS